MTFTVKIHPGEIEIEAEEGHTLLDVVIRGGLFIESLCSGRGLCGRCIVTVQSGSSSPLEAEERILGKEATTAGLRLACVTKVATDMEISVPADTIRLAEGADISPVPERTSFPLSSIGEGNYVFKVGESRIFLGRVSDPVCGVALDAGTTTIESLLVDLKDGSIKAESRELNRQISIGTDIVSRISYGIKSDGNREILRKALFRSIEKSLADLFRFAGVERENVVALTISGNVFIMHSLLGKSMTNLAKFPFSPPLPDTLLLSDSLPLPVHGSGCIILYPAPGAFVGGDLVAGAISLSLDVEGTPAVLVDIGTNTEILVRKGNRWVVTSAPSGGAFEGAEMKCGKLAIPGAVTKCEYDTEIVLQVIGGGEPDGISGSGIVSLVSLLLSIKVITPDGRILSPAEARGLAPPSVLWRLSGIDGENAFLLYLPERGGRPVYLGQGDVRNFQTAKGAIRAGLETALTELGLAPEDVERVYVSGAFGRGVDEEALTVTGIFPPGFRGKVIKAGNTSLSGAYLSLVMKESMMRAKDFSGKVSVLHLGGNRLFSEKFIEHMNF
jgi:uncharacterized 2Fe-2S/4Fe-4S cluster protein (DUF4445 family)